MYFSEELAVPYGSVPCPAVLCRDVLNFFFEYTAVVLGIHAIRSTDRYVCTCVIVFFSLSSLLLDCCPHSVLLIVFRQLHPSGRDIANKHKQHNTGQSALRVKQLLALPNR